MTLQDLGNVGEFFASIGVIVTLIYLAVKRFFNTRVYGWNPMPRRIEVPRRERLLLTLPTAS